MKIILLQEAFDEFNNAIEYYEEQQSQLGLKLKEEIDENINWLIHNSTVPRLRKGGYRRINLKIFPYYISYIVRERTIWVLAIAHSHRKPEFWVNRKNKI